jgi:hypothetical protein
LDRQFPVNRAQDKLIKKFREPPMALKMQSLAEIPSEGAAARFAPLLMTNVDVDILETAESGWRSHPQVKG